jgi:hypothetical protein
MRNKRLLLLLIVSTVSGFSGFIPAAAYEIQKGQEAYIDLPANPLQTATPKYTYPTVVIPTIDVSINKKLTTPQPEEGIVTPDGTQVPVSFGQNGKQEASVSGVNGQVTLTAVQYGNQTLFRLNDTDYLIPWPVPSFDNQPALVNRANQLNDLQKLYPSVLFYAYYVTRAADCKWIGSFDSPFFHDNYSFFTKMLGDDTKVKTAQYIIKDFQDYMDTGYKTDFHVNYIGSYRIYQDLYQMISEDLELSPMLQPVKTLDFDDMRMIGDLFEQETLDEVDLPYEATDAFIAYKFELGSYKSFVDDKEMVIGLEEEYEAGEIEHDPRFGHQFAYYGGQTGVVRFEFDHPDKPNLLIISDSQGRPSRKLLAYHFNKTIYLDDIQSRILDLDQIIKENNIGVVIFMGQISMFELYQE